MKKLLLLPFLLLAVLSMAACGGPTTNRLRPDSPKLPNSPAEETIRTIPIRSLPKAAADTWYFTVRARVIPNVWRDRSGRHSTAT